MKGTEMFDAIAHIDEDLIDRCLADGNNAGKGLQLKDAGDAKAVKAPAESNRRFLYLAAMLAGAAAIIIATACAATGKKAKKEEGR